jgi:hypothetical protein
MRVIGCAGSKPLSSSPPLPSPTAPAVPPRSSSGQRPTLFVWQKPSPSFSLPLLLASIPPSPLPSVPFERRRSSSGLKSTLCASQVSSQLFSLPLRASVPYQPLPISPFAPAPFSAAKLPILFASVCCCSGMFRNHLATRSGKSLGLTSLRATALLAAPHEAAEAHWLDLPLLSLGV